VRRAGQLFDRQQPHDLDDLLQRHGAKMRPGATYQPGRKTKLVSGHLVHGRKLSLRLTRDHVSLDHISLDHISLCAVVSSGNARCQPESQGTGTTLRLSVQPGPAAGIPSLLAVWFRKFNKFCEPRTL
jgi:hypothetical protein